MPPSPPAVRLAHGLAAGFSDRIVPLSCEAPTTAWVRNGVLTVGFLAAAAARRGKGATAATWEGCI